MATDAAPSQKPWPGDRVQGDAERSQHDADQRGGVLECHGLGGGVRREFQVLERGPVLRVCLTSQLPDRLEPGDPLEDEGDAEHDVGDDEAGQLLGLDDGPNALVDRVAGPEHEDAHGGQQRPEVSLHAVAEGCWMSAGFLLRFRAAIKKTWLSVSANECAASAIIAVEPGDQSAGQLRDSDREVGAPCQQDRAGRTPRPSVSPRRR